MQAPTMIHSDCIECDVLWRQLRWSLISTLRYEIGENHNILIVIYIQDVRLLLHVCEACLRDAHDNVISISDAFALFEKKVHLSN